MGPPGCGKTTYYKQRFGCHSYISQDLIKSKSKCDKKYMEYINQGKNIVIDNTNPSKESRKNFIDIAKKIISVFVVYILIYLKK